MIKISAIIPVKNGEKLITDAIKTVSWCDEIIVVDNGSTDRSVGLARQLGAVVVDCPTDGIDFSKPHNIGAKKAKGEWLFYLDTDERVSEKLKDEIKQVISKTTLSGYCLPRKNNLLGHDMRYGGWWPDKVMRLIKKGCLVKWEGRLHEQPVIKGKTGRLTNPLYHISHRSLAEMIDKTNEWSLLEAQLLYKAGHPKMVWWRFLSVGFREFWYRGVVKMGFLDGVVGVIEIIYQMFSRMITYAKLWELQKNESRNL